MKKILIPLMAIALVIGLVVPGTVAYVNPADCEDEEDPVHIYYGGSEIGGPPGPIVWTGPCTAESFDITVRIEWDSPPTPPGKNVFYVDVQMIEISDYGMTFTPSETRLYNPNQPSVPAGPDYCDVKVTVPVAGLSADIYAANIKVKVKFQGPDSSPEVPGTNGYFQFKKEVCTTPPLSITAPDDITVEGNTREGATGVVLGTPTVSGGTPPYIITNDAPEFFPLGETIVTWTVTDANGNTASDTQTVTVVDTTPPSITVDSKVTVTVGAPSTVLPQPTVSDIVDPSPTVTNDAPDYFPLGVTIVTWTATDASGNSATATTEVTAIYGFNGLLSPYVGPPKAFKLGSSIPLKWQYTDYPGTAVDSPAANPSVVIKLVVAGETPTETPIELNDPGSSGLRYDALTMTWQFNWQTKGSTAGGYNIYIISGQTGQINGPFPIALKK